MFRLAKTTNKLNVIPEDFCLIQTKNYSYLRSINSYRWAIYSPFCFKLEQAQLILQSKYYMTINLTTLLLLFYVINYLVHISTGHINAWREVHVSASISYNRMLHTADSKVLRTTKWKSAVFPEREHNNVVMYCSQGHVPISWLVKSSGKPTAYNGSRIVCLSG